jgi:N-acetylglutamate synthase-like GNAT family acetyltransferase
MVIIVEEDRYKYNELVPFFIEQELEMDPVQPDDEIPDDILACWVAEDDDEMLLGACVLATREGEYICDGIATAPEARGKGVASILLDFLLKEVERRGGRKLFLVAKAPGFFKLNSFVTIDRADAPEFFECFSCEQYEETCHPEVMRYDIVPQS